MNPQDANAQDPSIIQPQAQQAQPQDNAQNDAQVENSFIIQSASQILADEQANPGSQDPEALAWARSKVGDMPVAPAMPAAAVPQPPQPAQQPAGPIATSQGGDEGEIVWDKPADPTVNPPTAPDNATTNGDNTWQQ